MMLDAKKLLRPKEPVADESVRSYSSVLENPKARFI